MTGPGPAWSREAGEADWIGERLTSFDEHVVTSVVPAGFDAYARVLHPAQEPGWGGEERLVRWAEVAAWSGVPVRRDAQFHSIALPPIRPAAGAPWSSQGPDEGRLYLPDAEVLAGLVRQWTTTPERCWFCVWDGYGWPGAVLAPSGQTAVSLPDPVPEDVRGGPRVRLPNRDNLLYSGPVEAVTAVAALSGLEQTPNLWWPADRAWCVATEVDLAWTYVGGPAGLIERILADERIEALPAALGDSLSHVEDWVASSADRAAAALLAAGEAVISTSRGTVRAWLDRPSRFRHRRLRTETAADNGVSGTGIVSLNSDGGPELSEEISAYLAREVIGLVG